MTNQQKSNPIGIFDSGIGGLTVVKKIFENLPNENIIYFGDTARVPYGSKSNQTVVEYSIQNTKFLLKKNVKMVVVACNTASSVALDVLRNEFNVPIIGMIEPGSKTALNITKNNHIGVIGTNATINNKAYSHRLKKLNNKIKVYESACPLFVPLAEEGWTNHKATQLIANEYLKKFKEHEIDTLILGCTHYPILNDIIQKSVGKKVKLIDSGTSAAIEVNNLLEALDLRNDSKRKGNHQFYVSDVPRKFQEVAERFLGKKISHIEKIDLEELIKS
ncbi:MAG: glutamate racemase [Melioribacteraceae bacterium]|nr:glutamate racemase [Melioribacteraceae bacterium]